MLNNQLMPDDAKISSMCDDCFDDVDVMMSMCDGWLEGRGGEVGMAGWIGVGKGGEKVGE